MTVRELISRLETFHPDLEVAVKDSDTGHALPEPEVFMASSREHPSPFVAFFGTYIGEDWGPCGEEGDYA